MSDLHINSTTGRPADFYIPADASDAKQLDDNRATLWPAMWFCVIVVVAIIALCIHFFTWQPVVIALVIIAVCGLALLVGYGSLHNMSKEEEKAAAIRVRRLTLPLRCVPESSGMRTDSSWAPRVISPVASRKLATRRNCRRPRINIQHGPRTAIGDRDGLQQPDGSPESQGQGVQDA